jgi:signal transduction histidine kinase
MRAEGPWLPSAAQERRYERRLALTVAAAFVVAGISWVLFSDAVLYEFTRDQVLVARLETAKGWIFVALAGIFLYAVARRSASRLNRSRAVTSAVVESIADGVLLLGADRTIAHANPAAVKMLGCEGAHDLVGMGAAEFSRRFRVSYPDGSIVPPDRFISQRVFEEGGPLHYKSVLHPPGGPEVVISATAAAVREEVGEPADVVVSVMHDISDIERLDQLRDQFFAAAAHSLKTPVAVIHANAQVLSRSSDPKLRRSTAAIERQCGRIDRLVKNLLVLARARSTTLQLHPTLLELGPLVERVVREMARACLQNEVHAEVAASPRVHADEERFALVLRNQIDVACRSSTASSPVTVRVTRDGPDAEVGVRYRALPPEDRTVEALGEYDDLGVSRCVTKLIVEAHGGALREETAGAETTAWLRLPAVEDRHERA